MRIGIDARPLQGETRFRGIGKSLERLLLALTAPPYNKHHFVFFVDKTLPTPRVLEQFTNGEIVLVPGNPLARKRFARSILTAFPLVHPNPSQLDVYFQYDAALGVPRKVPSVVVFHDLIPYLFHYQEQLQNRLGNGGCKARLAGKLYWRKYLRTLDEYRNASAVIAISEASRRDYAAFVCKDRQQRVVVIHHGLDSPTRASKPSKKIAGLADQQFLLYVGGIDFRKNIMELLRSYYTVKPHWPGLKLVLVGKEFGLDHMLTELGWSSLLRTRPDFAQDVITPGFVSDADLMHLYNHAQAFVFPSRYEGFGLPVLEAMQHGCPVIAYDNSSISEVANGAAYLVTDGMPLAPAIETILTDGSLRKKLSRLGEARARTFSWEKTAAATMAVLGDSARSSRISNNGPDKSSHG